MNIKMELVWVGVDVSIRLEWLELWSEGQFEVEIEVLAMFCISKVNAIKW